MKSSELESPDSLSIVFWFKVYLLSAKTGKYSSSDESKEVKALPEALEVEASEEEVHNLAALKEALPGSVDGPEGSLDKLSTDRSNELPRSTSTLPV